MYFQSRMVLYLWDSSMMKKVEFIQSQEPTSRWVLSLGRNHFLIGEENNRLILQLSLEKTLRSHLVQITQDGFNLHQNIALSQTQTVSSPKNCFITFNYTGQYLELGFFLKEIHLSLRIARENCLPLSNNSTLQEKLEYWKMKENTNFIRL